ncbi:Cytomatrix protein-like protein [Quillaja saponaria]|uniref:Cytomatrix protein-like protein n=1 Tax=Quillaja saponaria TaxID=32244 RepID=A0AAD7PJV7_QUISA|nr:Cytomatrix protein-like protein [Quillaja saponaria]
MRSRKASDVSSERRNWEKIFNGLVQMLRTQQTQLETLVKERKLLEDRITMQHEGWASDIRLCKDQISETRRALIFEEKKRMLEAKKADLVLSSKQREAYLTKWMLGNTEDELAYFKAWFGYHIFDQPLNKNDICKRRSEEPSKRNEDGRDSHFNSVKNTDEKRSKVLEGEVRRLKRECEKLALEKSSEVSALLAEKKFAWNQYNIMENNYRNKLNRKHSEVEKASEKIEILASSMEQLQSTNDKKNGIISRLETKVANMEAEASRLNGEISRLSVELELLKKSRSAQVTPVLNRCTEGTKTSCLGNKNSCRSRSNVIVKKESYAVSAPNPAKESEKGGRSLKRKGIEVSPFSEAPKLFSANFKVPKLKNTSSRRI